ncbi:MAG: cytochrome P450 [Herpetosiphonaceae bacterium]|nr:MAG: cytochrome P450 [Herpetosiphonaceae bacterium]
MVERAALADIPKMPGSPVLGNLLTYRRDRLSFLLDVYRTCGDVAGFRLGPWPVILLSSPLYADAILVEAAETFEKSPLLRKFMRPIIGNGLLTSENAFHRRQRKLVAPSFQHRHLAVYAETMSTTAEQSHRSWGDGEIIDVHAEMMRIGLAIVGKTLFGADVSDTANTVLRAAHTILSCIDKRALSLMPPPISWPTPNNRRLRQAITQLDQIVYRLIKERRAAGHDRDDILSILLRAQDTDDGSFMTPGQVRDEIMTLFLAGHETTASALSWTWLLLAQHPDIYGRLQAEVDHILGGRTPTFDDLPHLPYTLQVFKEAMRLYPPAYMLGRRVVTPTVVRDLVIPAGVSVVVSPYVLHRREEYYPHADRFNPDRFLPDEEARRPKHAYLPFGGGPRICIGRHFALMEGHLILATLAQRVTFELVPDMQVEPEPLLTLRPRHGLKLRVRRRQEGH